jgi:hypothetical protein
MKTENAPHYSSWTPNRMSLFEILTILSVTLIKLPRIHLNWKLWPLWTWRTRTHCFTQSIYNLFAS